METMENKGNKMGYMPVKGLLISMSLPMMVSMLVQALYNVVDSIFVSRISEDALAAVSLSFPVQNLMIAVGVGTAIGMNALLSRALGEKEQEKADSVAVNGVFLILVCYLIFVLAGLLFIKPFFAGLTNSSQVGIRQMGEEYLSVICLFSIGMFTQIIFERLFQSTGKTVYAMIIQGTGAIINIILDPILIFGLFGAPKMGVMGAAAATVIGQCIAAIIGVILNQKKNHEIKISIKGFRPDMTVIGAIYKIGVPSILMQAIGSIMVYAMNGILISFTSTATAVFGAYFKLQSFVFMPVFGLNNGLIPIVAFNYGAGDKKRVTEAIRWSAAYGIGIMFIGSVVMQLFPGELLLLFDASAKMLEIGIPALRIISLCFCFAGYCIVVGSVFQSLGYAWYSMIISIGRQLIVLIPSAYILSKIGGLSSVWWAFPLAEFTSVVLSTFFLFKLNREVISHIGEE